MTTYPTTVRFSKLKFDDCVEYDNRKVSLTHYDTDCKTPLFLQFVDNNARPVYCVGFKNAIQWLKTGVLEVSTPKLKKSKVVIDGKLLIVTTWVSGNGGTEFSLNFDDDDLDVWEFEREVFSNMSDNTRSNLNLFSPWSRNIFSPSKPMERDEIRKLPSFPSTFDVLHHNLAQHILERLELVRKTA